MWASKTRRASLGQHYQALHWDQRLLARIAGTIFLVAIEDEITHDIIQFANSNREQVVTKSPQPLAMRIWRIRSIKKQ